MGELSSIHSDIHALQSRKTSLPSSLIQDTHSMESKESNKQNPDFLKYVEKKMVDKGVQRMERHPSDGLSLTHNPKSGRGGKYTWEGPGGAAEKELEAVPPAIDEKDPNYVDEEEEDSQLKELVVGEVEVAKAVEDREGVGRVEVDPHLQL